MQPRRPLFLMYTTAPRPPEGLRAQYRGYLSYVLGTSQVLPGHPPTTCTGFMAANIVWSTVTPTRLRPAGAGHHHCDLRCVPQLPRWRPGRGGSRQKLGVNIFPPSPTAIRMLLKSARRAAEVNYHFKNMTTVGDRSSPRYGAVTTRGRQVRVLLITDTCGTENGGFLSARCPALSADEAVSAAPFVSAFTR